MKPTSVRTGCSLPVACLFLFLGAHGPITLLFSTAEFRQEQKRDESADIDALRNQAISLENRERYLEAVGAFPPTLRVKTHDVAFLRRGGGNFFPLGKRGCAA